jgi:organic hydroperoxide reductase OsmC/OhrA
MAATADGTAPQTHRYTGRLRWQGSTAEGIAHYTRAHEAICAPGEPDGPPPLALSADAAFRGDPAKLNPEQLLVLAVSSCQMLSFLAVAARARVHVTSYEDDAEGEMPEDEQPMRIVRITLRPCVTVTEPAPDDARLRHLVETAHRHCFIANSLSPDTHVAIKPSFVRTTA